MMMNILRKYAHLIVALVAAAGGALFMAYRLDDPLGGYHSFNEGFYLLNALKDVGRGVLIPITSPVDINNPWFYPWLLAQTLKVFGSHVVVARWLSVFATSAVVVLVYVVGKIVYNSRIGMTAAVITAFTPGMLLVGRNIQIEAVLLALTFGTLAAYLQAVRTKDYRWGVLAGVIAGIGMMTKLPFVIVLISLLVWRLWESRGVAWLKERYTLAAAAALALTAGPWYIVRAVNPAYRAAQDYLGSTWQPFSFSEFYRNVYLEMFWMLSPVLVGLLLLGLYFALKSRKSADKLLLSLLGVHALFFTFYHFHTYYYVPLVPFAALLAGRGLSGAGLRSPRRLTSVLVVTVLLLGAGSVYTLAGKKYSMYPLDFPYDVAFRAGLDPSETVVEVQERFWGSFGPAIAAEAVLQGMPPAVVESQESTKAPAKGRLLVAEAGRTGPGISTISEMKGVGRAPVLFGYAVVHDSLSDIHRFVWSPPQFIRVGGLTRFGWWQEDFTAGADAIYLLSPTTDEAK